MSEADVQKKRNCLVVEDNFHAADIMHIFFEKNGIGCDVAENGEVGLRMYMENPQGYDVIFCDLQMPVMDGYAMTKQIRSSGTLTAATIPIVAMSGMITEDVVSTSGFSFLLKKPFELRCLLTILDEQLQKD